MRVVAIYDDERKEIVTYVSTCGSKAVKKWLIKAK